MYFNVKFNVFFKLTKMRLLVSELYSALVFVDCYSSAVFIQRFFILERLLSLSLFLSEEHVKNTKLFSNKKEGVFTYFYRMT